MPDYVVSEERESQAARPEPFDTVESTLAESVVTATEPPEEPHTEDTPTIPLVAQKRYFRVNWWSIVAVMLLLILLGEHGVPLAVSLATAYVHPTATVTLFPTSKKLTETYTFLAVTGTADQSQQQIPSRLLTFTTSTTILTVKTTGRGKTPPTQAIGAITFYNEAPYEQTIGAGTVLTGYDGIQVVTDETAYVKPGNPPYLGSATVSAHAIQGGTLGNIVPAGINTPCCLSGISAKNMESFTGGEDPQSYPIVSNADLQNVVHQLAPTLDPQAKEAITNQMKGNEQLLTSLQCTSHTVSTPGVGERATTAQVSVSETCGVQVYDSTTLQALTRSHFLQDVAAQAGADFLPKDAGGVTIEKTTLLDRSHSTYTLSVRAAGTLIFHLTASQLQSLALQMAGKKIDQARTALLRMQGIQGVYIQPGRESDTAFPTDPGQIHIIVS